MFISRIFQSLKGGSSCKCLRKFETSSTSGTKNFRLRKALIITKLSRYESEQAKHPNLNQEQLEKLLRNRGTDYDALLFTHKIHKDFEQRVAESFKSAGVDVKLTNRASINKDTLTWADILVPVGGDGTFLLAASKSSPLFATEHHKIPIVGFNSDPNRSEGRLMLHKEYSEKPQEAVNRIVSGDFRWMSRSRIRTTLLSNSGNMPEAIDFHENAQQHMSDVNETQPEELSDELSRKYKARMKRILPYLALNEVFIGEAFSARVSHLQIVIDHGDTVNRTKCSGLCVSTGTGSTSWHTSINRLSAKHVKDLVNILKEADNTLNGVNPEVIAERYNQSLLFPPDDLRLCYSIREQVSVRVWPAPKEFEPRGFVRKLVVKSKCVDAGLVIDGSIAYRFNDGAKALLEVHPEDALLTIALD